MSSHTTNNTSSNACQLANHRRLIKLITMFSGYALLGILCLSLILPVIARTDRDDVHMRNTTQARGIVQGLITYGGTNKERYPGLTSKGYIILDDGTDQSLTGRSGHGATVEARFWLLLDNNSFSGEYLVSPTETKTAWTTGSVTSANYSYAMLNIHSNGEQPADEKTRPDQTGRAREWRQTINTMAVLIADRARIPDGKIGDDYHKIHSVFTTPESELWIGSIGRGDGSASFDMADTVDTKYAAGEYTSNDRLFAIDPDSDPEIDRISRPDAIWDDRSNALLGYTSVGYQDPDIASE